MKFARLAGALLVAFTAAALILNAPGLLKAAGDYPGLPQVGIPQYQFPTGTEVVPADTGLAGGVFPQTVTMPPSVIAGTTWGSPRNFLGNGALNITNTQGTATVTCATTSAATTAALSADRWMCDANVGSGAGNTAIVTTAPAPPTGFTNVMKVNRASGSLTQPICVWSAVPTVQAVQLAGQTVTFSAYAAALATLTADNGNVANLVIIAGSGTDQGLNGAWTASPAITPAWTTITTVVNTPIQLTTTFARFSTTAVIPATVGAALAVTEVGVGLCFTPTANTVGVTAATDGFAWTGAQLEKAPAASLFEFRSKAQENLEAQYYIYKVTEGAASTFRGMCNVVTTSIANCQVHFPVPMYKVPTMSYATGFSACTQIACSSLTACTANTTSITVSTNVVNNQDALMDCASSAGFIVGAAYWADDAGTGIIWAWTGL
jgi:hypothetical protein